MSNKISRKTRLKIYDFSLKLHKNKGFNPYKITKAINKNNSLLEHYWEMEHCA